MTSDSGMVHEGQKGPFSFHLGFYGASGYSDGAGSVILVSFTLGCMRILYLAGFFRGAIRKELGCGLLGRCVRYRQWFISWCFAGSMTKRKYM